MKLQLPRRAWKLKLPRAAKLLPLRAACACVVLLAAVASALAQDPPGRRAAPAATPTAQTPAESRTNADESFELNIAERRINERDYEASTEVEVGAPDGSSGLNLRVGVRVGAREIDVLLRNVFGRVRFRATLDPVLRLINARRPAEAPAAPATPSPPSP